VSYSLSGSLKKIHSILFFLSVTFSDDAWISFGYIFT
jgi:hypothetical protein